MKLYDYNYTIVYKSLFEIVAMASACCNMEYAWFYFTEPGEREWVILWQQIEASYGSRKVWLHHAGVDFRGAVCIDQCLHPNLGPQ